MRMMHGNFEVADLRLVNIMDAIMFQLLVQLYLVMPSNQNFELCI